MAPATASAQMNISDQSALVDLSMNADIVTTSMDLSMMRLPVTRDAEI